MANVRTTPGELLTFLEPLGRCQLCGEKIYGRTVLYPGPWLTKNGMKVAYNSTRCQGCRAYEKYHPDMTFEQLVEKRRAADMTFKPDIGSTEWQRDAACGQLRYAGLFDELTDSAAWPYSREHAMARGHCDACPVRDMCLDFAVRNKESGTRGGFYLLHGRIQVAKRSILKEVAA